MGVFLLATVGFVGVHAIGLAITKRPDEPTFSVTRAVISAGLVLLGFAALAEQWPNRFRAFMARHPTDDFAFLVSAMLAAALVADFVWMVWRFARWRVPSRRDLLVHHAMAVPALAYAFDHRVGFGLIGVAATTELMAVCSGVVATGRLRGRPELQALGRRCCIAVLIGWRIPVWLFLTIVSIRILANPAARAGFTVEYSILVATTILLCALDVFWVAEMRASLRESERANGKPALILRANEETR